MGNVRGWCQQAKARPPAQANRCGSPSPRSTLPILPKYPHPSLLPPHTLPRAQASGYAGLLLAAPTVLYEITAYVVPGLTKSERAFLAPVVFGSSTLFYLG